MTMTTPPPLDLDQIRSRTNTASPGPWTPTYGNYNDLHFGDCGPASGVQMPGAEKGFFVPGFPPEDAEFIAAARSDVPALIAEVARLRELARERARLILGIAEEARRVGIGRQPTLGEAISRAVAHVKGTEL